MLVKQKYIILIETTFDFLGSIDTLGLAFECDE